MEGPGDGDSGEPRLPFNVHSRGPEPSLAAVCEMRDGRSEQAEQELSERVHLYH